jgi:nucleoid DNA-binding protein
MTRTQLVNKLSNRMNVSKKIGEFYFKSFMDSIIESLNKSGRVIFRGFGSFKVTEYKARIAKKPITGELFQIPIRHKVVFHPGKELRQKINSEKLIEGNKEIFINYMQASEKV